MVDKKEENQFEKRIQKTFDAAKKKGKDNRFLGNSDDMKITFPDKKAK